MLIRLFNGLGIMAGEQGPKLFKRRVLGRKAIRNLRTEAEGLLGGAKTNAVSQAEVEDGSTIYIFERVALLSRRKDTLFPTLLNNILDSMPSAVVDMGAIPFVCNGADVMAPGIVEVEGDFPEGGLLVIRDVRHRKALAVGKAMLSSEEMRNKDKGKVIVNLHHVGDKIWSAIS